MYIYIYMSFAYCLWYRTNAPVRIQRSQVVWVYGDQAKAQQPYIATTNQIYINAVRTYENTYTYIYIHIYMCLLSVVYRLEQMSHWGYNILEFNK